MAKKQPTYPYMQPKVDPDSLLFRLAWLFIRFCGGILVVAGFLVLFITLSLWF